MRSRVRSRTLRRARARVHRSGSPILVGKCGQNVGTPHLSSATEVAHRRHARRGRGAARSRFSAVQRPSATQGRHNRHLHLITLTGRRPRDAPGVPHLTKANLATMVLRLAASTPVPAAEQAAKTFPIADYIVRVAQSKAHCVPRWNTVPPRRMRRMGCQQQTLCQMASTRGWPLHLRPNPPPTWSLDRSYCDRARTLRSLSDLELDSLVIFQRTAPRISE
jgi:hypothetical protein